jgi:DNA-directed RNA polymerase specialized sigma24 family protein
MDKCELSAQGTDVKKSEPPSPEEFDRMLDWLDPDRDRAGERFLEIRARVTKILVRRQCYAAEELWDETANRVCHRVKDVAPTYVGDPALYFYGVARLVHKEWLAEEKWKRERMDDWPPEPPEPDVNIERIHECLDGCLNKLDREEHALILQYYEKETRAKIEQRKALAEKSGITLNSLRMRVHRINGQLQKCILACLDDLETKASDDFGQEAINR